MRQRSGLARDHGVTLVNSPGTIDSDYTGPVIVMVIYLLIARKLGAFEHL